MRGWLRQPAPYGDKVIVSPNGHKPYSDGRFLYSVNQQSDSITRVDLASGSVVQVLYLQDLLHALYVPLLWKPAH